jgi:predicted negative regulator of RcsB-dependent stress response
MANFRSNDDPAAAKALYRRAIDAGEAHWSARAAVLLGELLAAQGDTEGAHAAWRQVIDADE